MGDIDAKKLYWSLFNEKSDRQIDGLTYSQARGFFDSLIDYQLDEWFAWHEGLPHWKPMQEFEEFTNNGDSSIRQLPPHPPKRMSQNGVADTARATAQDISPTLELRDDETRISVQLDQKGYSDHRLNRRFAQHYAVQIACRGAVHQNETLDISIGGMALKQRLPEGIGSRFMATLIRSNGEKLDLVCLLIPEKNDSLKSRIRFQINSDSEAALRTWLLGSEEDHRS